MSHLYLSRRSSLRKVNIFEELYLRRNRVVSIVENIPVVVFSSNWRKYVHEVLANRLGKACPGKVRLGQLPVPTRPQLFTVT